MDMLKLLRSKTKSKCPKCGVNNNCALENGKSLSACWCRNYPVVDTSDIQDQTSCLCRDCLKKELEK